MFKFVHPRYWLTWLGFALLWLVAQLPWRWQMQLGKGLGLLLFSLLSSRRQIACVNLAIAYPQLTQNERKSLNRRHFISMAQGLIDSSLAWWHRDKALARSTIIGLENLKKAEQEGSGIILLAIHLSSLEITGALLSQIKKVGIVYRPHRNILINTLVQSFRSHYGKAIPRDNIRGMIRYLKAGKKVWYAPDQSSINKNSYLSSFFGEQAMTNSGTARMIKMTGAKVLTCVTYRVNDAKGKAAYQLVISPPLNDFPLDDIKASTDYLNQHFEQLINQHPEQYFWTHKRYKRDGYNFYQRYINQHTHCS